MTAHTEAYASDCLTLTRTHSTAALKRWNQSLALMNSANGALNSEVSAIRNDSSAPPS